MDDAKPQGEAPWALQLAVRVERTDRPTVAEVCRAAAAATLALLEDERARPGGVWQPSIAAWRSARIRKLVRRGRGGQWLAAQSLPGVTVHEGAEVRAFLPAPMDAIDPALAKLQIDASAVELHEPEPCDTIRASNGCLVVALTPLVAMSWAKRAAQAAHGAQLAWEAASPGELAAWQAQSRRVEAVFPSASAWPAIVAAALVQVHDGGFTEIPAGTLTAVAWFVPQR